MKQNTIKILGFLGLAVATTFTACDNPNTTATESSTFDNTIIEGQYIVRVNDAQLKIAPGADRMSIIKDYSDQIMSDNTIQTDVAFRHYGNSISGFAAKLTSAQAQELANDPRVISIEPDRIVMLAPPPGKGPKDGGGGDDGGGGASTQVTPWGITRVGGAIDATGKTAWIIDSGVDLDHPDLNVDVARSRTFITSGKDSKNADDGNGHGTHCAGTVAALDNNIGVIGVAPGATIVGIKVLDSRGSGAYSGVIAGVDYVASAASAGDVANMSLGGPASPALESAVSAAADKGILFAIAAGNEAQHANNSSPARVNHPNVYTVSAMNSSDVFASFSNFGNPPVDFCAPGVAVESTWKSGGYNTISGTSMASPHVAGLLLVTNGSVKTSGFVQGDPDGNPDPIAHN